MNTEVSNPTNPYSAPQSKIEAPLSIDDAPQPVKIFSIKGRIGRVRYIGYTVGLSFLMMFLGTLLGAITYGGGLISGYIALLVTQVMLTIQRCHDFNTSGWLSLLALIPFVGLIFWVIPGTNGPNNFGNRTAPNSTSAILLACILPIIILAVLAPVAIPAYQDLAKRAAAQSQ